MCQENVMRWKKKKIIRGCEIHYIKTMEKYCVNCEENTTNKNSSVRRTKEID